MLRLAVGAWITVELLSKRGPSLAYELLLLITLFVALRTGWFERSYFLARRTFGAGDGL